MPTEFDWHSGGSNGGGDLPTAPLRIGKYTIVSRISHGGMGSVYEALQDQPRRVIALKLMHRLQSTSEQRERFRREAELLGQLHHPNIAVIFDAGSHDEQGLLIPYIAMERVQGGRSIGEYCKACSADWRAIVDLMIGVAEALSYAHERGVLHRDIKPANILVDDFGVPKIVDFGVGKFADQSTDDLHTSQSLLVGTLQYMSPEQAAHGEFDHRSDQYSFAMVLYELLCGRLPYIIDRSRPMESAETIATAIPISPVKLSAAIPPDLAKVVLKALAKEPRDRYANMTNLAADLRRVLDGVAVRAHPISWWTRFVRNLRQIGFAHRTATIVVTSIIAILLGYDLAGFADEREFAPMYERALITQLNHIPDAPLKDVAIIAMTNDTDFDYLANVTGFSTEQLREPRGLRPAYAKLLERLAAHQPRVVTMSITFESGDDYEDELVAGAEKLRDASIPLVVAVRGFDPARTKRRMPMGLEPLCDSGISLGEGGPSMPWSAFVAVERRRYPPVPSIAMISFAHYHNEDPSLVRLTQGVIRVGDGLEFPYSVPEESAHERDQFEVEKLDLITHYVVEIPPTDVLWQNVTDCGDFFAMSDDQAAKLVNNRIVQIADFRSSKDHQPHPDGRFLPAQFMHAATMQSLIDGTVIRTAFPFRTGNMALDWSLMVLIVSGVIGAIASAGCSSRRSRLIGVALIALLPVVASCACYQWYGWIWRPIGPMVAIVTSWFLVGLARSAAYRRPLR